MARYCSCRMMPPGRAAGWPVPTLCRGFATAGGRKAAAGINALPEADVDRFVATFYSAYRDD
jgi:hypothetical protein